MNVIRYLIYILEQAKKMIGQFASFPISYFVFTMLYEKKKKIGRKLLQSIFLAAQTGKGSGFGILREGCWKRSASILDYKDLYPPSSTQHNTYRVLIGHHTTQQNNHLLIRGCIYNIFRSLFYLGL